MEERHLSLGEVAEVLSKNERTIRRWIKSGKLRAYKPGRDYLIPESAIGELIEGSEVYPKDLEPSLFEEPTRLHKPIDLRRYDVGELLALKDELEAERGRLRRGYSLEGFFDPTPEELRIRDAHIAVLENSLNVRDALDRKAGRVK
ncbi:MAG: helix-turn-helix domain-containing protein [Actinomycetota bacterium]|nr:helix-turn-helix domain-containing protein [Actinomycetota bacterium]